jgi:hypothetical protein
MRITNTDKMYAGSEYRRTFVIRNVKGGHEAIAKMFPLHKNKGNWESQRCDYEFTRTLHPWWKFWGGNWTTTVTVHYGRPSGRPTDA